MKRVPLKNSIYYYEQYSINLNISNNSNVILTTGVTFRTAVSIGYSNARGGWLSFMRLITAYFYVNVEAFNKCKFIIYRKIDDLWLNRIYIYNIL